MVFSISHYRVRFEQRNNGVQNFRSAYLQTHTTICHDSSCNNTSIPCSILNLAWFGERKGSITYLILKSSEMQCWCWCCSPIQMSTMPCNDGSLRSFGSMVHGKPHSSNCHLRCFGKQEMMKAGQMIFDGSRELTKVFLWGNNEGDSRVLSVLAGFCYLVKNQLKAKGGIWSCGCWVCLLGFCKWAENWLYIIC